MQLDRRGILDEQDQGNLKRKTRTGEETCYVPGGMWLPQMQPIRRLSRVESFFLFFFLNCSRSDVCFAVICGRLATWVWSRHEHRIRFCRDRSPSGRRCPPLSPVSCIGSGGKAR
ncbi:hypothetical protein NDU88_006072 [Pleurodeles waltl]|uniref:Uncharacterized protein n=1 Tax=Pleurodeles waltl TaxID=8319 RepID=A0AAV7TZ76_PLEWA|nr:hypothetical protein NDU88_006072 [Pleurodeles waltl]